MRHALRLGRTFLPIARGLAFTVAAAAGLGGLSTGCSATTGIDVEVRGGDVAGIHQIQVTGQLGDAGVKLTPVKAPSTPRLFGAVEDVRIVLQDGEADEVVWVTVQAFDAQNNTIGEEQQAAAILVANHTKRVRVCYGGVSCQ